MLGFTIFFGNGLVTDRTNNSKLLFLFAMQWLPDGNNAIFKKF